MRRRVEIAILGVAALAGAVAGAVLAQGDAGGGAPVKAEPGERVIRIVAKRFVYNPDAIVLKKGQPVAFELTTLDFEHGFSIPDLDFRADFVPGKTNVVRLTPQKAGKFEFLCDNFCGSGHEEMDGHMTVEE